VCDYDRAEEVYRQALTIPPPLSDDQVSQREYIEGLVEVCNNLGSLLFGRRRDLEAAGELFKRAIALDDRNVQGRCNLGAMSQIVHRDPVTAARWYDQALEIDPAHIPTLLNYALLLRAEVGDLRRSEAMYERAMAADPTDAGVLSDYAVFLLQVRKDTVRAEAMLLEAVALDGSHVDALSNLGTLYFHFRKDYDSAEQQWKEALRHDPAHAPTLAGYGALLVKVRKDYAGGEDMYRRALLADPHNLDALIQCAIFQHTMHKNYALADTLFQHAVELSPGNPDLLNNYGVLKTDLRQAEAASYLFQRALELSPTHVQAAINYGSLLARQGSFDDAERLLRRAIESDSANTAALSAYGAFLLSARRDAYRAETMFAKACSLPSADATALCNYAAVLLRRAKKEPAKEEREAVFEKAKAALERAVGLSEDNPRALAVAETYLGHYHWHARRNHAKAREKYEAAVDADGSLVEAVFSLGALLHDLDEPDAVVEPYFRRVLSLNPNHTETLMRYAMLVHAHRGETDRAHSFFKRAQLSSPQNSDVLTNYAAFVFEAQGDAERANEMLLKAVALDPSNYWALANLGHVAKFSDTKAADEFYARALEVSTAQGQRSAVILTQYATFLFQFRKENEKAMLLFEEALRLNPEHIGTLQNFSVFLREVKNNQVRANTLYQRALKLRAPVKTADPAKQQGSALKAAATTVHHVRSNNPLATVPLAAADLSSPLSASASASLPRVPQPPETPKASGVVRPSPFAQAAAAQAASPASAVIAAAISMGGPSAPASATSSQAEIVAPTAAAAAAAAGAVTDASTLNQPHQQPSDFKTPLRFNPGRRKSVSAEVFNQMQTGTGPATTVIPKSEAARRRIATAISRNLLFSHLDAAQTAEVIDAMAERAVERGETIIKQGAEGDFFYVVEKGSLLVFVDDAQVGTITSGGSFGELALMYSSPRAATVTAVDNDVLWALDRQTFRKILLINMLNHRRKVETFLKNVPLLTTLTAYERGVVADALEYKTYQPGDVVFRQGDPGDAFYIVEQGTLQATQQATREVSEVPVGDLKEGDYFGEVALLKDSPRNATITATSVAKVAYMNRGAFTRLLGPCLVILERNMDAYKTADQVLKSMAQDEAAAASAEPVAKKLQLVVTSDSGDEKSGGGENEEEEEEEEEEVDDDGVDGEEEEVDDADDDDDEVSGAEEEDENDPHRHKLAPKRGALARVAQLPISAEALQSDPALVALRAQPPGGFYWRRRAAVSAEVLKDRSAGGGGSKTSPASSRRALASKSIEARGRLTEVLNKLRKRNFLFASLDDLQRKELIDAMFEVQKPKGAIVIHQGEEGDNFYILESGECDVIVRRSDGTSAVQGMLRAGSTFGELSLMYFCPRAATVLCTKNCVLWALDRQTFRRTLQLTALNKRRSLEDFLKNVPVLSLITPYERASLADCMFEITYEDGAYVCRQGEIGDRFFIVADGEAIVTQAPSRHVTPLVVATCKRGDYFGELALISSTSRRVANVIAKGTLKLLCVDRASFTRLLGPCDRILRRNISQYRKYEEVMALANEEHSAEAAEQLERITGNHHDLRSTAAAASGNTLATSSSSGQVAMPKTLSSDSLSDGELLDAARSNLLLAALPPQTQREAIGRMERLPEHPEGTVLAKKWESPTHLYFVVRGRLKVDAGDGYPVMLGPGGSVGAPEIITHRVLQADVIVMEPRTVIFGLPVKDFARLIGKPTEARRNLILPLLKDIVIFGSLTPAEQSVVASVLTTRVYARGDRLIEQDAKPDHLYFITSGSVRIVREDPPGKIAFETTIGSGNYCGEVSFLEDTNRAASVIVLEDNTRVLILKGSLFHLLPQSVNGLFKLNLVSMAKAK
jgi:CRP-like cAMP-binding protein/Tfp pilus assembly protein PilF